MADGTKKPIGELAVGDRVVATKSETGETTVRTVTKLWTHVDADLLDGIVLTGNGVETIAAGNTKNATVHSYCKDRAVNAKINDGRWSEVPW
jgi:hypothetical protein